MKFTPKTDFVPPKLMNPVATAAAQLRVVMEAEFSARPLLNRGERRLLSLLDKILAEESPGWRAMGQVSLGEILASPNEAAFFAVNSKRVDLLIVDADCRPLHAVEMQGQGRHQSDRSEEHTSELQSLMRISYAVFCLQKKTKK